MHPIKRCRRSLAYPNRTLTEYHEVDHGVAVGRPRQFCFIPPIVGGPELEYLSRAPFFPFFLAGRLTENSLFRALALGDNITDL